jgi:prevent-host-death family protein
MTRSAQQTKPAEQARQEFPALLSAAANGQTTVITRRGEPLAAVVPLNEVRTRKPASLVPLFGSGAGMWGKHVSRTIDKLRDEWTR